MENKTFIQEREEFQQANCYLQQSAIVNEIYLSLYENPDALHDFIASQLENFNNRDYNLEVIHNSIFDDLHNFAKMQLVK